MIALGNFLFRYRNALFPLLIVLLLLLPAWPLFDDPLVAAIAGGGVALAGQSVRAFTIGLQYIKRGGRMGRVYAEGLVTGGAYGLCRNPMYVGNLLLVGGIALASNSASTLSAALLLAGLAYRAIVAAEEEYLGRRFGDAFQAYRRDVPRWIPRWRALRELLAGGSFRWRRVIVKEYGTPFGWIGLLTVVVLYRFWQAGELAARRGAVRWLLVLLVVATVLWATVMFLKKTRRLVAD